MFALAQGRQLTSFSAVCRSTCSRHLGKGSFSSVETQPKSHSKKQDVDVLGTISRLRPQRHSKDELYDALNAIVRPKGSDVKGGRYQRATPVADWTDAAKFPPGLIYRLPVTFDPTNPTFGRDAPVVDPNHGTTDLTPFAGAEPSTVFALDPRPLLETRIPPKNLAAIPRLHHGLDRVLFNPGIHPLKDWHSGRYNFSPFLETIAQPDEIAYESLPPFVPSSMDNTLRDLARTHGKKYTGSTSSMSDVLSQLYSLFSNFKPVPLDSLSPELQTHPNRFTQVSLKPAVIMLRPRGGGLYAIDKGSGNRPPSNQILLDLGKSLEKVMTLEEAAYAQKVLKKNNPAQDTQPESYHYLQVGDFVLRSQIDCYNEDLPGPNKTFELKTRATFAVRTDIEHFRSHLGYRIRRLTGMENSFEREFYDMIRAAFLKYSFQVRIGKMNGLLVAYHSTREIFGFEYIPAPEMDLYLFGSTSLGDAAFDHGLKLLQMMLNRITEESNPQQTMKIVVWADFKANELNVFVEPIPIGEDKGWHGPANAVSSVFGSRDAAPVRWFKLHLNTYVNGSLVTKPFELAASDRLQTFYRFFEMQCEYRDLLQQYQLVLNHTGIYRDVAAAFAHLRRQP